MPPSTNVIVASATFVLFFVEALIHYNVGANAKNPKGESFKFYFPMGSALLKIVSVLFFFSMLNALVTSYFIESAEGHSIGEPEPSINQKQPPHLHYAPSPLLTPGTQQFEGAHVHLA